MADLSSTPFSTHHLPDVCFTTYESFRTNQLTSELSIQSLTLGSLYVDILYTHNNIMLNNFGLLLGTEGGVQESTFSLLAG